jgi:hypothetical protein
MKSGQHSAVELMTSQLGDATQDALSHYGLKLPSANQRLRGLYTLALGLGMRESSGNTTDAWDLPGADFQKFTKDCPSSATEYAMVMLRVDRAHYGSINRKEAEYLRVCYRLLADVESIAKRSCGNKGHAPARIVAPRPVGQQQ